MTGDDLAKRQTRMAKLEDENKLIRELAQEILTTAMLIYSQVDDHDADTPIPGVLQGYAIALGLEPGEAQVQVNDVVLSVLERQALIDIARRGEYIGGTACGEIASKVLTPRKVVSGAMTEGRLHSLSPRSDGEGK